MHPDDLTEAETQGIQRIIETAVQVASDLPTDSPVRAWCLRCTGMLRSMLGRRSDHLGLAAREDGAADDGDDEGGSAGRPTLRAV